MIFYAHTTCRYSLLTIAVLHKSLNELAKILFFHFHNWISIELSCWNYIFLAQPAAKIEYSTAASPDFYKDEKINITCKATGCTDLKNLQLRYEANGDSTVYRSGCSPSPEDDTVWESSSSPAIITVSGIEGPIVSNAYCASVGKPEGFSFSVQLTATISTLKGNFYCNGFEGGVGGFRSSEVSMEIKGKHFLLISLVTDSLYIPP